MKPVDNIRLIDASSIQPVEGYLPPDQGKTPVRVPSERVEGDALKVNQETTTEREQAKRIADRLNRMNRLFDRKIQFEVPSDTKDVIVKIVDRETGKVIRQIPPPDLVKLANKIDEIHEFIFKSKP
jgi:flagellar protein FlaG